MRPMSVVLKTVVLMSLTGCATVEDLSGRISEQMRAAEQARHQSQMETARRRCTDYGYEPGTETYAACVQKEFSEQQQSRILPNHGTSASSASGCALYEHDQFAGVVHRLKPGAMATTLHAFNDKTSSARVGPSCTLELFEHDDFRGERRILRQDTAALGASWNDRVSSAKCLCR